MPLKPRSVTLLISSKEKYLKKKKGKKNPTYWLIMLHLADGLVHVAFQLQRVICRDNKTWDCSA